MAQMGQQQTTQSGMSGQGVSLSERELLQIALNEAKYTAAAVNTFALESSSDTLRRDYLTILGDVHNQEKQIYDLMQQKGYYNVKNANPQDIAQVQSKFSQGQ
ncbi:Coat F domain protein [Sporomusa ovata DSM 2662]|uniref:Coat F domain protein n=1 Tax=Sporomusa ovata TaxID=2378 RepID=A0A0U1KUJ4_9FIRM|nr:spore coat protein [Sporomusa ovata]EQB26967.1 coat F domain containing protein [Sporomusa ovata DSM 2662]CQR71072.1 Coat F domain protein [Sporomusa ovata]